MFDSKRPFKTDIQLTYEGRTIEVKNIKPIGFMLKYEKFSCIIKF